MKRHLRILTVVAAALAATTSLAYAKTLKGYTYIEATTTPAFQGLQLLAEEFGKATGGKVTIKPNVGGSLPISATDITQAVSQGVLDVADDQFFSGNFESGGLLRLPFLMPSLADYEKGRVIWNEIAKPQIESLGIKILADYHYPEQVIFASKPVTKLDDLKGLRVRVGSPEQGALMERLGAIPATLTPAEVPTALQSGVVDAVITASAGGGRVWRDFFTHNYRLPVNWVNCVIVANADAFERLTPEQQKALQDAAKKAADYIQTTLMNSDDSSTQKFKDTGMVVTKPTPEEIAKAKKAIKGYWEQWAASKGPATQKGLDRILEAVSN